MSAAPAAPAPAAAIDPEATTLTRPHRSMTKTAWVFMGPFAIF